MRINGFRSLGRDVALDISEFVFSLTCILQSCGCYIAGILLLCFMEVILVFLVQLHISSLRQTSVSLHRAMDGYSPLAFHLSPVLLIFSLVSRSSALAYKQ